MAFVAADRGAGVDASAVAGDVGVLVEVRNRFDGSWSHGFEIVECLTDGASGPRYRLRRLSDRVVLPASFTADDLIAQRR
jgi:hypothetical protein